MNVNEELGKLYLSSVQLQEQYLLLQKENVELKNQLAEFKKLDPPIIKNDDGSGYQQAN